MRTSRPGMKRSWLESYDEAEEVLKIRQPPLAGRRQMRTDRILPDGLAETVTHAQRARQREVDSDVRSQRDFGRSDRFGRRRKTAGDRPADVATDEPHDAKPGTEVRTDAAPERPEIDQRVCNDDVLLAAAVLFVEGAAGRHADGGDQRQVVAVPHVVGLQAEIP